MEDAGSSTGLSVFLSAAAVEPLQFEDDFGFGLDFGLDWDKDAEVKVKEEPFDDSLANSPTSSLFDEEGSHSPFSNIPSIECGIGESGCNFPSYDHFFTDPSISYPMKEEKSVGPIRKPVMVRKRIRECSMVCWLFRTLLTSEYRALPLNAIFEIFEDTNRSAAQGRHWRQSIRHCLMSSAVFVRVLTPNPRKDFLVMNEAGSWWTVHPDCETTCAEEVFRPGAGHRCPPNTGTGVVRMRSYLVDDTSEIIVRDTAKDKWKNDKIFSAKKKPLNERPKKQQFPLRSPASISLFSNSHVNPSRGDHLVVDHEEEVIG